MLGESSKLCQLKDAVVLQLVITGQMSRLGAGRQLSSPQGAEQSRANKTLGTNHSFEADAKSLRCVILNSRNLRVVKS